MAGHRRPAGWWAVQWSDRLAVGAVEQVRVGELSLVVYRGKSGRVYAVDAVSPDRGFPLTEADVIDDSLHSLIDGNVWSPEGSGCTADGHSRLAHYPVSEQAGLILVGIGGEGVRNAVPELGIGAPQWRPATDEPTWLGEGSPLIALENLSDATSLGYVLGRPVITGPHVVSKAPDDLQLRYRVSDSPSGGTSERAVDVHVKSPGLMWLREESGSGALFAVTPLDENHVAIRACIGTAGDGSLDWAGCIDRQVQLTGLIRRVSEPKLNDEERCAGEALRDWLGAVA